MASPLEEKTKEAWGSGDGTLKDGTTETKNQTPSQAGESAIGPGGHPAGQPGIPSGGYLVTPPPAGASVIPTGAYPVPQPVGASSIPTGAYPVPPPHPTYLQQGSLPQSQPQNQDQTPTRVAIVVGDVQHEKKLSDAYLLGIPLGFLGAHHFYMRKYNMALMYMFTFGLLGCGWVGDWFRMPCIVKEVNRKIREGDEGKKNLMDAYTTWFPLGLFGFHHYYLGRPGWGIAYTFTLGFLSIGWLVDFFRMPQLVRDANEDLEQNRDKTKGLGTAYALGLPPPLGLLGAHHYYLGRPIFGLYHTLTLGGVGVSWLIDVCRMKFLVDRVNAEKKDPLLKNLKHLDDAYLLAFPLGFLGLHHLYLNRPGWFAIHFLTLGLLGIGMVVDWFRMPCLVADANRRIEEDRVLKLQVQSTLGNTQAPVTIEHRAYIVSPNPGVAMGGYIGPASAGETSPISDMQPPSYDSLVSDTGAPPMPVKHTEFV